VRPLPYGKYNRWNWRAAQALVLGALLIGVNAVLIWTLEHTDIVAFAVVLLFSSLSIFALFRLLWPTLRSTHLIDDRDAPTGRSKAKQPQDQIEPWPSGETRLEVLKPAADDLLQRLPVSKRVNSSGERPTMISH
jgi:hypothetical protein